MKRGPTIMLSELAFASWLTMAHRLTMMTLGTCTMAEYQRMWIEKVLAAQQSAFAALTPQRRSYTAAIAPWHRAASRNAKRLGRRKRR